MTIDSHDFETLWKDLCHIAKRGDPPMVIHRGARTKHRLRHGPVKGDVRSLGPDKPHLVGIGHVQRRRPGLEVPPFHSLFERYVDNGGLPFEIVDAVKSLKPARSDPSLPFDLKQARHRAWRVVAMVVTNGETDTEVCRRELGMSAQTFRTAAISGILTLRQRLGYEVWRE